MIGNLPDGQEERLEFWCRNHLLASFPDLFARKEIGTYGGRQIAFLSLQDLIRSKETERLKDWNDITYLEEALDSRLHKSYVAGTLTLKDALIQLRSRRGFDTYHTENCFTDRAVVRDALQHTSNPITQAFLLPWAADAEPLSSVVAIEPVVERKLRSIEPAGSLHRSLVEVIRRRYMVFCQDRDRADKEAIRAALKAENG